MILTVSIENFEKQISLFNYSFNVERSFDLFGLVIVR